MSNATNATNATGNATSAAGNAPTDAALLAALCGGFGAAVLLALALAFFAVCRRSRFAFCWAAGEGQAKAAAAAKGSDPHSDPHIIQGGQRESTWATRAWRRLGEHGRRIFFPCFPGAAAAGSSSSSSSSPCCCCDPRAFENRHACQTVWAHLFVLAIAVLPVALTLALGALVLLMIRPLTVGLGVLFLGVAMLSALYVSGSYTFNGYRLTRVARGCAVLCALCLVAYAFTAAAVTFSFTGVSSVALAFEMFLVVPALFLVSGAYGSSDGLMFASWVEAVGAYPEAELQKMAEAKAGGSVVDKLLKIETSATPASAAATGEDDATTDEGKGSEEGGGENKTNDDDADDDANMTGSGGNIGGQFTDAWKDTPVTELIPAVKLAARAAPSSDQGIPSNMTSALWLYVGGLVILVGYAVCVYLMSPEYWIKPLGFVTILAVLVFDTCLAILAGPQGANWTIVSVFVMILYRTLLVVGGAKFWFLGHTVCFLTVSIMLANTLVNHYTPVETAEAKKAKKCVSMLEYVQDSFEKTGISLDVSAEDVELSETAEAVVAVPEAGDGDGTADASDDTAITTFHEHLVSSKAVVVTLVVLWLAYIGEMMGVAYSALPPVLLSVSSGKIVLAQFNVGILAVLVSIFFSLALAARARYRNMLKEYVHDFVRRSPQEAKRRAIVAEQLKKNRNFRGNAGAETDRGDEGDVEDAPMEDAAVDQKHSDDANPTEDIQPMTTRDTLRFWFTSVHACRGGFVPVIIALYAVTVGLGVFFNITLRAPVAMIVCIFYPLVHSFAWAAYLRWSTLRDYDSDRTTVFLSLAAVLLLLIMSIVANAVEPNVPWLGFTIGASLLMIMTTFVAISAWFNTFAVTRSMIVAGATSALTLLVWATLMFTLVLKSEINYQSLSVLFVVLMYPTAVLIACGMCKWKDDNWNRSPFVNRSLGVAFLLVSVFFGVVAALFDMTVGLACFSFLVISMGTVVLFGIYKDGRKLSGHHGRTFSIAAVVVVLFVATLGAVAGWQRQSFILGFTLSWMSLVLLAIGYGLTIHFGPRDSTLSSEFYENELLFPVFSLDLKGDGVGTDAVLRSGNGLAASIFVVLWMTAVWGVVASAGGLPESDAWIGLGVLSLSLTFGVAAVCHLRATSRTKFEEIRDFVTFRMVSDAKKNAEKITRKRMRGVASRSKSSDSTATTVEEQKEGEDDKAGDDRLDLEGGEDTLISTTVSEATQNLRAAEDALCARWGGVKDEGDITAAGSAEDMLDQAYARVHAAHEILSRACLNDYLSRVAMQLFVVSAANARKSQREIALRSLMSDLERSLGFTIQPSSDPVTELANQTELCQKIRAFLERRKREEIECIRHEQEVAERERQRQERQRQAEAEAQRRREERERERKEMEERRRKREEEARRREEAARKKAIADGIAEEERRRRAEARERERKQREEEERKKEEDRLNFTPGSRAWAEREYAKALAAPGKFTDEEWPLDIRAGPEGSSEKRSARMWKRATEINNGPSGKPALFVDGLSHEDIAQGCSGTCYLCAGMASMAHEMPEILKSCFVKQNIEKGVYLIHLKGGSYKGEKECFMLMDDYFAVTRSRGKNTSLTFIRPAGYGGAGQKPDGSDQGRTYEKDMEMWAAMLEKAYVKACDPDTTNSSGFGSYKSNSGGWSHTAIQIISGVKGIIMSKRRTPHLWNVERMWPIMLQGVGGPGRQIGKGDMLACSTGSKEGMDHHNDMGNGLCPGHAYAILRAVEVDGHKLVQIMNPWGSENGEWTGDWSDASSKWTRRMKSKVDFHAKADGTFWMTMEDWCGAFNQFYWNSRERMDAVDCDFEKGTRVKAITDFCYNRDKTHKVRKGMVGTVIAIDEDGDMRIKFDDLPKNMWAFKRKYVVVPVSTV